MEKNLNRNLAFEIARMDPKVLLALECVKKKYSTFMDIDYMRHLLLDLYKIDCQSSDTS